MTHRALLHWVLLLCTPTVWSTQETATQKVSALGGRLFHKKGEVVEVVLNGATFKSGGLNFLSDFPQLTDLSLEKTSASDKDMLVVAKLPRLEWLNLYRTQVGDEGARHLSRSKSLKLLPAGGTKITDGGIAQLANAAQLTYLGLRANRITDKSAPPSSWSIRFLC